MSQTVEQLRDSLSCMTVSYHRWGVRRSGTRKENEIFSEAVSTESDLVGTWKKVLDVSMAEWKAINVAMGYAKWWWFENSFPYVHEGQRLFYKERQKEVKEKLVEMNGSIKDKAKAVDARREEILEWAKKKFPTTYDESVYPSNWRDEFGLSWIEHNIDPPQYLERDDEVSFKREMEARLSFIDTSMKQFESQCMSRMGQVAYHLSNNLGGDGNHGISKNVKGLMDLFDKVHAMKFAGTAAFQKCVKDTKALIEDLDPAELRKGNDVRDNVKKRLDEIIEKNKKLRAAVEARASEVNKKEEIVA